MFLNTIKYYEVMKSCLGLIFLDGINMGIQYSVLLHLVPTTDDQKHDELFSGIAVIVFGIGTLLGGYLGGKLCDKFQLKKVAIASVILYIISCVSIYIGS